MDRILFLFGIGIFSSIMLNSQDSIPYKAYNQDSSKVHIYLDSMWIDSVLIEAHKRLGIKHCMGGTTVKCFDCSGLVQHAFKQSPQALPHGSDNQAHYGRMVLSTDSLKRGDLLFFKDSYNSRHFVTHVGIYIKEGVFIHASAQSGVILTNLLESKYWKPKFVFAKRVFK